MEAGDRPKEPAKPGAAAGAGRGRKTADKPPSAKPADRRRMLRAGAVALAVLVALVAWLATRGDDNGSSEPATTEAAASPPRIVTVDELRDVAAKLGQPIYWAGPVPGKELELRELGEGGGVQILYQPEGTAAGEGSSA